MTSSKKKVLIVSYFYPPAGGAGSIRITKFVKYLPQFSWSPFVLTTLDPESPLRDESLFEEIPDETVTIRTRSIEPTKWRAQKLVAGNHDETDSTGRHPVRSRRVRSWIKGFVSKWLFIPDSRVGWIPFAVCSGYRMARKHRIAAVVASGPPWTNMVVGYLISLLANIPLIADYRDGWAALFSELHGKSLRGKIDGLLEKIIVRRSAAVVLVSDEMQALYSHKYPQVASQKMLVINNGFDEEDFRGFRPFADKVFRITYTGSFNHFQRAAPFLEGLKIAIQKNPDLEKDLEVNFYGSIGARDLESIQQLGLDGFISTGDYIPHRLIPRYLSRSSLLLLVLFEGPTSDIYLPCKTFEYVRSGIPILAIAPTSGPTARLVTGNGAGKVVQPERSDDIAEAIITYYHEHRHKDADTPAPKIHATFLNKYERRRQASLLATCLDRILQGSENEYPTPI